MKDAGVTPGSFFTWALDASNEPTSFFRWRRQVLGTTIDGGDPMTMPPTCGVLDVNKEDHDDDNVGASILRGTQCRCGIVSCG
jgi:hypothetical protein